MSIKSRNILMILGGGYLIYIGTQLILQTRQSHPQNETMFVAFGAGFAIFGAIVALFNLWEIWKDVRGKKKAEDDDSYIEMIEFDDEPEPVEERVRKRKKPVPMVKVERKEDMTLDIEDVKEELEAETVNIEEAAEMENAADMEAVTDSGEAAKTEEILVTEEEPAVNEEKDSGKADEAPADKNDTDEADEGTAAEELELNPDEAEEVFPTEEIKLERI